MLGGVKVRLVRVAGGGEGRWDSHAATTETAIVWRGDFADEFLDGTVALGPGQRCVVPVGAEHCGTSKGGARSSCLRTPPADWLKSTSNSMRARPGAGPALENSQRKSNRTPGVMRVCRTDGGFSSFRARLCIALPRTGFVPTSYALPSGTTRYLPGRRIPSIALLRVASSSQED